MPAAAAAPADVSTSPKIERITIQLPMSAKPLIDKVGDAIRQAIRKEIGIDTPLSTAKIVVAVLEAHVREMDAKASEDVADNVH